MTLFVALQGVTRRLSGSRRTNQLEGLDGGHHAPRQPEPVDMDKHIRARAGKGPQPIGSAPNGIPLRSLE